MTEALIEKHDWHLEQADAYETAEPGSAEYDAIRATVDSDRETRRQLKLKVRWTTRPHMPRQCSRHTAPIHTRTPMMRAPMMPTMATTLASEGPRKRRLNTREGRASNGMCVSGVTPTTTPEVRPKSGCLDAATRAASLTGGLRQRIGN